MILYLDTSSLIKLYVDEEGSAEVAAQVEEASTVATSILAYAEARSALARLGQGGHLEDAAVQRAVAAFEADWRSFLRLPVTEDLCRRAGDLAQQHHLRGYDSLHLASYLDLEEKVRPQQIVLSAFDQELLGAAEAASDVR